MQNEPARTPLVVRRPAIALAALSAFALGFLSPDVAPPLARAAQSAVDALFWVYEWVGPALLFVALSATLAAFFGRPGGLERSVRLFGTLLGRKLMAIL